MHTVRDALKPLEPTGHVFLLGCGAPLGSVIGHVDANR